MRAKSSHEKLQLSVFDMTEQLRGESGISSEWFYLYHTLEIGEDK
jgi:hypothetical protein